MLNVRQATLQGISLRTVVPVVVGLAVTMLIVLTGSALWMAAVVFSIVGLAVFVRLGAIRLLYAYAALIWILPRLAIPGVETIIPLHLLLIGGLGVLWLISLFTETRDKRDKALPPFWPLVAVYSIGGFVGYVTGRSDIDPTNGMKFLVEASVIAPLLYLLVWRYMRSAGDGERLVLLLSLSTLAIGVLAFVFQGSAFWTPIPFEKEGLRLSGQYQFGGLYLIVTPVLMSTQLSMLIPALCSLAINSEARRRRLAAMALLVPLTLIILLAAGRSGWTGTIAGVALVVFFSARAGKVSLPKLGAVLAVGGFVALAAVSSMGIVNDEILRRLTSFGSLLEDDTVLFRYWIWGLGLDLIGQYPLGVGYQVILGLYGYPAHNQYILWGLGAGVGGFAAVVGFLLAWIARVGKALWASAHQAIPSRAVALGAVGAIIGAMIGINGDNISTSVGWTQSTLWMMLGLGAASLARGPSRTED